MPMIKPEPGLALRILRHPLTLLVRGFVLFIALYGFTAMAASQIAGLPDTPLQPLFVLACSIAAIRR